MKITIDVECTPVEARTFLGLPDVRPMQESVMADMEHRMRENLKLMDPDSMMRTWFPMGMDSMEKLQKAFWAGFQKSDKSDD
ncbi:MAG: DUF6489 family protein [Magnetospiraceae bacterium]